MAPTRHLKGNGLKAKLLRGGLGSIGIQMADVALSLAMAIVLARVLGTDGFGIYTYIFALISLLAMPAKFGMPGLVVRETARAEATGNWGLMRGVWHWANLVALGLSVVLAVASAVVAIIYASHFTTLQVVTFGWGLLFVPMLALGSLRGASLKGLRKVVWGQLPEKIIRPGLLISFVLLWNVFKQSDISANQVMALHVLAMAIAFAVGAFLLQKTKPAEIRAKPKPEYHGKHWFKTVLPFALISGMTQINNNIDLLMLGMLGSAPLVGIYRVATRGAKLNALGVTAINQVTQPYFARFHNAGDKKQVQRLATTSARANFLLALPITLAFWAFGESIISLVFGPDYTAAYEPLAILAGAHLLRTASGSLGVLLNMTDNENVNLRIAVVATVCNVVLNIALIPIWGISGAAAATGSAMLIRRAISLWIVYRQLGIDASVLGWTRQ